jgi:hypothetical protein
VVSASHSGNTFPSHAFQYILPSSKSFPTKTVQAFLLAVTTNVTVAAPHKTACSILEAAAYFESRSSLNYSMKCISIGVLSIISVNLLVELASFIIQNAQVTDYELSPLYRILTQQLTAIQTSQLWNPKVITVIARGDHRNLTWAGRTITNRSNCTLVSPFLCDKVWEDISFNADFHVFISCFPTLLHALPISSLVM